MLTKSREDLLSIAKVADDYCFHADNAYQWFKLFNEQIYYSISDEKKKIFFHDYIWIVIKGKRETDERRGSSS